MKEEIKKHDNKKEMQIRVKLHHPHKKFQLGRHSIDQTFKVYDLNEAEKAELKTKGPQTWLDIK